MSRRLLPILIPAVALVAAACDPATLLGSCGDDLLSRVDPRSRALRVGESYVAVASAWGCGGTKRLTDEWRYFAVDTTVLRVDALTGRVTARAPGATDVGARGQVYGDAPNRSRVTVTP